MQWYILLILLLLLLIFYNQTQKFVGSWLFFYDLSRIIYEMSSATLALIKEGPEAASLHEYLDRLMRTHFKEWRGVIHINLDVLLLKRCIWCCERCGYVREKRTLNYVQRPATELGGKNCLVEKKCDTVTSYAFIPYIRTNKMFNQNFYLR